MDDPSAVQREPGYVQLSIKASDLDHLVLNNDKVPSNKEVFAPDPDTIPYLTKALLEEEFADNNYVSPLLVSKIKTEDREHMVETTHQGCFRLAWENIKKLANLDDLIG